MDHQLQESIQRAKQLATTPQNSNALKRPLTSDPTTVPMKKFNSDTLVITQEILEVPQPAIGLVIGRGGEQVRNIMGLSGCEIQVGGEGDKLGYRQIILAGSKDQIEHAKLLITNLVTSKTLGGVGHERKSSGSQQSSFYDVPEVVSVKVMIPAEKCGLIIGKNGESIKSLQERFDVKMQLIQDNKAITGPKPLQITGYPEKVETARRFIEENYCVPDLTSFYHTSPSYQSGPKCILQVLVPKSFVGLIIGKNGEMIKKISYESGAKIQFDNDETENPDERKAIVQGTKAQVDRAALLIAEMIDSQVYYMHVPANKSGAVIGKGGETIQQISAESGARVQISKDVPTNPNERIFEIKGKPLQIQKAMHLIKIRVGDLPYGAPFPQPGVGGNSGTIPTLPNFATPTISLGSGILGGYSQNFGVYSPQVQMPMAQPQANYYANVPIQGQLMQQQQAQIPMINTQQAQLAQTQPDYSLQWIEYYRKMGLFEKAAEVEKFASEQNKKAGNMGQLQTNQQTQNLMAGIGSSGIQTYQTQPYAFK